MNRLRRCISRLAAVAGIGLLAGSAGSALADFNSLSATPNTLFQNTTTSVRFVADVQPDPALIKNGIRLLRETNGVFGVVGTMNDDGLNGDAVANDNRYTLNLNVQTAGPSELNFRASAAYRGVLKRVQSSILPVQVVAPVDLQINAGQQEITLLEGESVSTAFTLQVSNQGGGLATVAATQAINPTGGLSVISDLPPGGFSTSSPMQTFVLQNSLTAEIAGEYTVTLDGTLSAGSTTDNASASILVHVLPANGVGKLDLTSYPSGLKQGTSEPITFSATYSLGSAQPEMIQLVETNEDGQPVQSLAAMEDDGVLPDVGEGDLLFTAESSVSAGAAGTARYFKAMAAFGDGSVAESQVLPIPSLPFDIGFLSGNPAFLVMDTASGESYYCDQVLITAEPDTPLDHIILAAASVRGTVIGAEPGIHAYQLAVPCNGVAGVQSAIATLEATSGITSAVPNIVVEPAAMTPNDSSYASQWAPKHVRTDEAWLITRGKAVTIAVLDTGVDYGHEDLSGAVVKGKDHINNDNDPKDDYFHGTHVAGIAAARGNNSKGIAGVAWETKVYAVKVCGGKAGMPGVGKVVGCEIAAQIAGLNEAKAKAKIINMSINNSTTSYKPLADAVAAALSAGRLVVHAAGNNNNSTEKYPCEKAALCVGNSTSSDTRSPTSNFGSHVNIAAPGHRILSTVPTFHEASGYSSETGTSMSAPLVSGVAALVWANNPSWTYSQVKDRLLKTTVPMPSQNIGPRIDAFDAVFNGSFEHDLSGWKVVGTGSAVDKLGPINPTKDKRMGMASTGPDAAVSQSELYQEFTIQPDVTELALSFSYAMITEEYPEWINQGFNDDFRVTLETPGGGQQDLALETVDGSAFTAIVGIDFPGGDSTVGWTGWKNVVSKKIPVAPGGGTYRLRVRDQGDGIFDTNGILDNIGFK